MNKRLELHEILCEIVNITEPNGDRHVYFNTPESYKMRYPAIRYSRKPPNVLRANDGLYGQKDGYDLIVIDEDPDSEIVNKIQQLPYCRTESFYVADNLNHTKFTIYY